MGKQDYTRKEPEPPLAIKEWGWTYHHMGVPTTRKMKGERYLPHSSVRWCQSGYDRA